MSSNNSAQVKINRAIALIVAALVLYVGVGIVLTLVFLAMYEIFDRFSALVMIEATTRFLALVAVIGAIFWHKGRIYSLLRTDSWFGAASRVDGDYGANNPVAVESKPPAPTTASAVSSGAASRIEEDYGMNNQGQLEHLQLLRSIDGHLRVIESRLGWILFLLVLPLIMLGIMLFSFLMIFTQGF